MLSYYNHINGNIKKSRNNPQSPTNITLLGSEIRQILQRTPYEVTKKLSNNIYNNNSDNVYSKLVRTKYDDYHYSSCYDQFNIQIKWITFRNEMIDELLKLNGDLYLEGNTNICEFRKNTVNIDDIQNINVPSSLFYRPLRPLYSPGIISNTSGSNILYNNKKVGSLKKNKFRNNIRNIIKTLRIKVRHAFTLKSRNPYENYIDAKNGTTPSTITTSNINLLPTEQSPSIRFCVSPLGENLYNETIYGGSEDDTIESFGYLIHHTSLVDNSSHSVSLYHTNILNYF